MAQLKPILAALGLGLAAMTACSPPPTKPVNRPSAMNPAGDIARGRRLAGTCLTCHGPSEPQSDDPPFHVPRLGHQRASSIFYALHDYRTGRRSSDVMQPLAAQLSDQQMRDVAAYLTAEPLKIPKPELMGSAAYQLTQSRCGFCHGETGLGEVDGAPILTGQHQSYLEHALAAYRSGSRREPTMRAVAAGLSPEQASLAASYYAAQHGLETSR